MDTMPLSILQNRIAAVACESIPALGPYYAKVVEAISKNIRSATDIHPDLTQEFLLETLAGRNLMKLFFKTTQELIDGKK